MIKTMLRYISLILICFITVNAIGQSELNSTEKSDPKAKMLLDQLKNKYESLNSLQVDFDLIIEFPAQAPDVQSGMMLQKGKMYAIDFSHQKVYNNGEHLWLHLKAAEEVQLYNASQFEDSEDSLDPDRLLRIYETGDYAYAITYEGKYEGKQISQIEFKPIDRNSEYAKMRLTVDKANQFPLELIVFSKDGSRYTLKIKGFKENPTLLDQIFTFDSKANPDLYVEDLRM